MVVYLSATDGENNVTYPFNTDNGGFSFFVSLFETFAREVPRGRRNYFHIPGNTGSFPGSLSGLKLYRNTEPNVSIDPGNLIQEFGTDDNSFVDTDTYEGDTHYYKLTGILGDQTEALVSNEISVQSDDATKVRVLGQIVLSDTETSDYSGVKVLFEKVSPAAISDSLVTQEDGAVDIILQTGIYNVHFSRDGYQPQLQGNVFFSDNVDLGTIDMEVGGSLVISGDISGILLNTNVHFVDGDINVLEGDSLLIQPGTLIKFRGNYDFKVDGKLTADAYC